MDAPEVINNVSKSQFSPSIHYGGCTLMGNQYVYVQETDSLVRADVLKKTKEKKAAPKANNQEQIGFDF